MIPNRRDSAAANASGSSETTPIGIALPRRPKTPHTPWTIFLYTNNLRRLAASCKDFIRILGLRPYRVSLQQATRPTNARSLFLLEGRGCAQHFCECDPGKRRDVLVLEILFGHCVH